LGKRPSLNLSKENDISNEIEPVKRVKIQEEAIILNNNKRLIINGLSYIPCEYKLSYKNLQSDNFSFDLLNTTNESYILSNYAPSDYIRAVLLNPCYVEKVIIEAPMIGSEKMNLKKINGATIEILLENQLEEKWVPIGTIAVDENDRSCTVLVNKRVKAIQV